ncbi:MAG: PAS domain S-box protein, partial [Ignavibacteriales bacterium]|nr:PAS domain S-box protein [Ignavibacteriales bacterium]
FVVLFLRRFEILKHKRYLGTMYFAGLFSFAIVLSGLLPSPVTYDGTIMLSNYVYYVTWMSILFSVGITLLYSHVKGFSGKNFKSNVLFTGFIVLFLVLPTPFTYSLATLFFPGALEWYEITATFALLVSVYLLFRHKILLTLYDSFKAALTVMNDIFLMTDERFTIEAASGALTQVLGFSERSFVGRSLNDLLEQKDYIKNYLEYVQKKKMTECQFDADIKDKQGNLLTLNFSFSPVFESDRIAGFVGMGRDITSRKHAEEALKKSEERYRELVENISEGFYVSDANGRFLYASPMVYERTGTTPETLMGTSYLRIVMPEDRRRLRDYYSSRIQDNSRDVTVEFRINQQHGLPLWLEQTTRIIRDAEGKPVEFRSIVRDISERKQAEEKIRLLASALESTTELVSISDGRNGISYVNKALLRTFGYSVEELLGKNPRILLSSNNGMLSNDEAANIFSGGWSGELLGKKKDGTEFPVFFSTAEIKEPEGEVAGIINVARDISIYKNLEEQLLQSQKLDSVGTLAGGIAHDFNNILTIIMGYATAIQRAKGNPDKILQSSEDIKKTVKRGAGIVRELLITARKSETEFTSVNVNELIEDISKLLKDTFPRTIEFRLQTSSSLPNIIADPNQLRQVLLNLCVNARDAMPKGGVLRIETSKLDGTLVQTQFPSASSASYIYIVIADTGTGIPPEIRERIFEPFFTTKERGQGTGLGLSVVYGIVQGHHGFIKLESEPGAGTEFHLYFPVPLYEVEAEIEQPEITEVSKGVETILFVEDETLLMELMKMQLESQGYRVLPAFDGEEAIHIYRQHMDSIAMVIYDLGLPKLDGRESFRELRNIN